MKNRSPVRGDECEYNRGPSLAAEKRIDNDRDGFRLPAATSNECNGLHAMAYSLFKNGATDLLYDRKPLTICSQ